MRTEELLEKVRQLKAMMFHRATGGVGEAGDYAELRRELLADPALKKRLPKFLHFCTNMSEFWGFIKEKFPGYQERRNYLWDEFLPAIDYLENGANHPSRSAVSAVLTTVDSEHVRDAWQKALDRWMTDPDGAITSARTLIESVCKHILDGTGIPYEDGWDLSKLYAEAAKQLRLSPAQHGEDIFRQILGGCHSVVQGMAGLRNRFSDAHGRGKTGVKPEPRHAELAVNLAGSMATFLVATWEARAAKNR